MTGTKQWLEKRKEVSRRIFFQESSGKLVLLLPKDRRKKAIYRREKDKKEKTTNPIFAAVAIPVEDIELTPGPLVVSMISQPGQEVA